MVEKSAPQRNVEKDYRIGALEYFECKGEDLRTKSMGGMKPRSFVEMSKAKKG